MSYDENIMAIMKSFHQRKISKLCIYIEGFGGFFLSRVKDGFVIGYMDKNKRFGVDDHVTVFYGKHGLEGVHRKVSDDETDVYMKFETSAFVSPEGRNKLQGDLQERRDMKTITKILYTILYRLAAQAYAQGEKMAEKARLLDLSEARKKGLKSPCIYIRLGFTQRLIFYIYNRNVLLQAYLANLVLGDQIAKLFTEQNLPGSQITKHPKAEMVTHQSD